MCSKEKPKLQAATFSFSKDSATVGDEFKDLVVETGTSEKKFSNAAATSASDLITLLSIIRLNSLLFSLDLPASLLIILQVALITLSLFFYFRAQV